MPPECACPLCGTIIPEPPLTILPERGMVVAGGKFAVLTGHEMLLVQRMAEIFPRILTKEAALEWMYQFSTDEPEAKIIDVYVCKARRKLAPIGVRIDTAWGKGYSLAVTARPRIVSEEAA